MLVSSDFYPIRKLGPKSLPTLKKNGDFSCICPDQQSHLTFGKGMHNGSALGKEGLDWDIQGQMSKGLLNFGAFTVFGFFMFCTFTSASAASI